MKFVTTCFAVSAIVVSLAGAASAQGVNIGTENRGGASGTLGAGSGASGRASGAAGGNVGAQTPGANVGVGVEGQGSARTKSGTTGAGASGKARSDIKGGVSIGR